MAECLELIESQSSELQDAASGVAEDENLAEQMQGMVLPSIQSIVKTDSSNPTHSLVGNGNTVMSGCNFNITNIYGVKGDIRETSVTEVHSQCPLPPRSETKELNPLAGERPSSSPSPKSTKSNQEMLLRVVPFATEMEDCEDDLILVVWFCRDDDQTLQKIVRSEHESGNITLDSYDTIILKSPFSKDSSTISVVLDDNENYSWKPRERRKMIQSYRLWYADRAKCFFRIHKNRKDPASDLMFMTLKVTTNHSAGAQFILKRKIPDIRMSKEEKKELLQLLETKTSVPSMVHSKCAQCDDADNDGHCFHKDISGINLTCTEQSHLTCWAIPYIDRMSSIDDDVIVTLWLCWYDKEGKLLDGLKGEQKLYRRERLDTENSFVLSNREDSIEAQIKHNGNYFCAGNHKATNAHKIMQGMRAKFQFLSKRVQDSYDYAEPRSCAKGKNEPSDMEKKGNGDDSSSWSKSNNGSRQRKVKPNKLDIEISTWQGKQVPVEFRRVTKIKTFVCKEKSKSRYHVFRRASTMRFSLFKTYRRERPPSRETPRPPEPPQPSRAPLRPYDDEFEKGIVKYFFGTDDEYEKGLLTTSVPLPKRQRLPNRHEDHGTELPGDYVRRGLSVRRGLPVRRGLSAEPSPTRPPPPTRDFKKHVLRLYIFSSQDEGCNNALIMHVILVGSSGNIHDTLTPEWSNLDSYDTFLLTSHTGRRCDPPVNVSFRAHKTSNWHPVSEKMVMNVQDVLTKGVVKCSCRFNATSNTDNELFYGIMRISQRVGESKEEVQFVVKKRIGDIQTPREGSSSTRENILMSPVQRPEDADKGVILHEYQTCLAVPYVDLMQNSSDDIILTVWICSIQQSKTDFNNLCEDQKKFMKIQLDTENSFVFSDMTSPVNAKVYLHGLWTYEDSVKTVDPRKIRDSGRAKFQFICTRRHPNEQCNKFDVEITISQGHRNQVQFMTRKKIEFLLRDDLPTTVQLTETEVQQTVEGLYDKV